MNDVLDIFRTLADPTRLRILALLRQMELSVGELAQVLGQSQPRVSRHIKILADARLIDRRKEGSWVFLALGDPARLDPIFAAIDAWSVDQGDHWGLADVARLAAVRADRAAAAERYFESQAANWDAVRSLHVPEAEVEAAMARALGQRPLGRLVDIGTGTGRMLELFGARAQSALGVDRSPEMLRLARAKLADRGVDLRQGDMYALPLDSGSADTVILHQVLHYAQQPALAIAEAARLLAPSGVFCIVDFAAHDHEELRSRDAHARLGFDDDQIARWFAAAGLDGGAVDSLPGDVLTVKLWLGRRPAAIKDLAA
ncbi:ArsR/SmtB family transcription factor [Sphingomonas sp. ID0503]|uniref:ArsR/SmtB family transcription factor n=1 Tax=Sphingomonas sp. ID0503 TaxID=3399691 RepID=UPI003AFB37B6